MTEFGQIDSAQERKFQGWLRSHGINPDEWFADREWTKEELEVWEKGCPGPEIARCCSGHRD